MPYQLVDNGTKIKYIYVNPNRNPLHQNIIGFIGKWPVEFDDMFEVDHDRQWESAFQTVIERFFKVMNWGDRINLEENILENLIEF